MKISKDIKKIHRTKTKLIFATFFAKEVVSKRCRIGFCCSTLQEKETPDTVKSKEEREKKKIERARTFITLWVCMYKREREIYIWKQYIRPLDPPLPLIPV